MTIIIKNISSAKFASANLNDIGITIATANQKTIDPSQYRLWAASAIGGDALTEVTTGRIKVNNGTVDLLVDGGLIYLEQFGVSFGGVVRSDAITDITAIEAETLTDGSNADVLHTHVGGIGNGGSFANDHYDFGDSGKIADVFMKSSMTNHVSDDSTNLAIKDGSVSIVTISTEKELNNNWFLQIIINATKDGVGVFQGGSQIGTDLEKPSGQLDIIHEGLTGFNFSKGDRVQAFVKKGTAGSGKDLGKAIEPAVRLYVNFSS